MDSFSRAVSRRSFLASMGAGALGLAGWSRAHGQDPGTSTVVQPSAAFGTQTPEQAGFAAEVTDKMSAFLQGEVQAGTVPGAFVAAMRHGKVFLEQHFGVYCDRTRRDAPYDGAAIHPYHSISKMISATAVVMAWQDGLIDLDAKVMQYIPEFGAGGKQDITIRECLDHSAGIPKPPPEGLKTDTEELWVAAIAALAREPIQWPAGSRTEYHAESGMLVAAECVRRMSNRKPWNQICQERIFTPIGLSTLTFGDPPANLPLACIPRVPDPVTQWPLVFSIFAGQPAAALKGSPADILKFLAFHSAKGVWAGKTLLQEKYWTAMHTPQFLDKPPYVPGQPGFESWGLGMMVRGSRPKTFSLDWFGLGKTTRPGIFSHVGTDIAMAVGDPDSDTQIIFITTDKPKTGVKTIELRDTVTATIFDALAPA